MIKREKIVVIGRGTPLEDEICNLGRSLGHQMVSVSERGRPEVEEPWVSGIEWVELGGGSAGDDLDVVMENSYAVVLCEHTDHRVSAGGSKLLAQDAQRFAGIVAAQAERMGVSKFVWVRTGEGKSHRIMQAGEGVERVGGEEVLEPIYKEIETDLLARSFRATVFRPTEIFGQGIAMPYEQGAFMGVIPLEIVAMAALRASLEPDTCGVMDRDAIELYGDAMMIQLK